MDVKSLLLEFILLSVTHSTYIVPGRPPSFVVTPQTTYTSQTSGLRLNCTVDGSPAPTITWLRGNPLQPLTDFNGTVVNGTLIIQNVTVGLDTSETGVQYQCRANNSFGTILSKPINVFTSYFGGFLGPPSITYYVENVTGQARDEIALYCNISSAVPPPVIVWVDDRNLTVVNDGVNYLYIDNGLYLVIINFDPANASRSFYCRVTNAFSNMVMDSPTRYRFNATSYSTSLVFVYLPLRNVTAYDGDTNVQFYFVTARIGNTQLGFNILYPLSPQISISGSSTVPVIGTVAGPVHISDSGAVIQVSDSSFVTQTATLTVLPPLRLTSSPSNSLDNFEGDSASFTCTYFMDQGITLSWYKDGVQLNSNSPHLQFSGASLNIPFLFVNDSGMYQCSVSNGADLSWAQWALAVRRPNLNLVSSNVMSPLVIQSGGNVTLTFQVQADPSPIVQWYFNDSLILNMSVYQTAVTPADNTSGSTLYNASLTIESLDLTTQGYYYAVYSNRAGNGKISSVFVTPPVDGRILSFTAIPQCINLGSSIKLVCSVFGYPYPAVTFVGVSMSGRVSRDGNTLTIVNLTSTDSTSYICRISNGAEMSIQPLVCPILTAAGGGVVTAGSPVNIVCTSNTNFNGQTVTWYKSGAMIETSTINQFSSTLTLSNVQTTSSGTYSCSVTGVSSNNVTLTVLAVSGPDFSIGAIVGIAVGGSAGLLLLIVIIVIACVCLASRKKGAFNVPVTMSSVAPDKGNVDKDSDEEDGAPTAEAFNPQYESLPALRPSQPPSYKPTPAYAGNVNNDAELKKISPLDTDSNHPQK